MQANTPHTIWPSSRHNYLLYYLYILGLYIIIGKSYINILLTLIPRHGPKSEGNSTPYSDSKHILFRIKKLLVQVMHIFSNWLAGFMTVLYFFPFQSPESGC